MRVLFTNWGKSDFKLRGQWGWVFGTGLLFILLGGVALALPVLSTLAISLSVATLLIVGGSAYLVQSFRMASGRSTTTRFLLSIVSISTGFLIWRYPAGGMLAIAIALSFYFFIGGAFQWNLATSMRPHKGWGLGVVSALASFFMGIALLVTFPLSTLWMPGALLGIDIIISGIAMVGFSLSLRSKKIHEVKAPPVEVKDFRDAA